MNEEVFAVAQPLECSRCGLQSAGTKEQPNTRLCDRNLCGQFVVKEAVKAAVQGRK